MKTTDLSTDELMMIVGAERQAHTHEEVQRAESELRQRASHQTERSAKRAKVVGRICAGLGVVSTLASLPVLGLFFLDIWTTNGNPASQYQVGSIGFAIVFVLAAFFQIVMGVLLLVGGLRFSRLDERGRRLLVAVTSAYRLLIVFMVLWMPIQAVWGTDISSLGLGELLPFLVMSVVSGAFYFWLLTLALRYFRSPVIAEICG